MAARLRLPAPIRVVFDGQSHNETPAPPNSIPDFLMHGRAIPWVEVAVGGAGWDELDPTQAARLFPQVRSGLTDVLIMNGGQGDVLDLGYTGAQAYTAAVDYKNAAVAAGFDAVLITTQPAFAAGVYPITGPMLTARAAYNALVLANSGGFDAVADISVDPLDDATDTTYFQFDRLHLTAVGAEAAADLIAPALDALLASL
jgi:lysophospholipase L1-like esterase